MLKYTILDLQTLTLFLINHGPIVNAGSFELTRREGAALVVVMV